MNGMLPLTMRPPKTLVILAFLSAVAFAQQKPSAPTFRSRTELVTVPVVVLRHGEHVSGLKPEDFTVEEDGKAQKVAAFEEITDKNAKVQIASPPPGIYTNEVLTEGPSSVLVFVLDLINTPINAQANAKKRMFEYLKSSYKPERPTMLAVLHPNGLRILHDFTSDPDVLIANIAKIKPAFDHNASATFTPPAGTDGYNSTDPESDRIEETFEAPSNPFDAYKTMQANNRLQTTFYQLQQLGRALSSVRGSKSMVWVFSAFTLPSSMNWQTGDVLDDYSKTLKILSASGISVYSIDAALETTNPGYVAPQYQMGRALPAMAFTSSTQAVQNLMDISQKTGGDYCLLRNKPDECFSKAVDFSSRYYLLAYYTHPSDKVAWHKLKVKVAGAGLQVRARSGFYSTPQNENADRRKVEIAQAFLSPVEYRDLPISVRWKTAAPASVKDGNNQQLFARNSDKRGFLLGITPEAITVDALDHNHIKLSIVAVAQDKTGKAISDVTQEIELHPTDADLERIRKNGFMYSNELKLPPGVVKARFIVRDDLGEHIGTVSAPVTD